MLGSSGRRGLLDPPVEAKAGSEENIEGVKPAVQFHPFPSLACPLCALGQGLTPGEAHSSFPTSCCQDPPHASGPGDVLRELAGGGLSSVLEPGCDMGVCELCV